MAKVKLNDVAIEARETWKQNKTDVPVVGLEHLEPDEIWLKRWDLNPDENTFTKGFKKGQLPRARVPSATPGGFALSDWPVERASAGG